MASDARDVGRAPETGQMPADEAVTAAEAVGKDPEMAALEQRHSRFVWPITVFFLAYYLLLPILAGQAKGLMGRKLFGEFTFGYLFALSEFLMAFVVAWFYTRWARTKMDPLAADLREKLHAQRIKEAAE